MVAADVPLIDNPGPVIPDFSPLDYGALDLIGYAGSNGTPPFRAQYVCGDAHAAEKNRHRSNGFSVVSFIAEYELTQTVHE